MSPSKLNRTLQQHFVLTELETGRKMLALAMTQRELHEEVEALRSLDLARVASSGAQRHLAEVKLRGPHVKQLWQDLRELERQIEGFASRLTRPCRGSAGA